MIFAVDKCIDMIREKKNKSQFPKYEWFDTVEDAKRFIINRAENRVTEAEDNLRDERDRLKWCYKKYGGKK